MAPFPLPYELISFVVQHLDLADIRNLSFSCKRFQYLLYEANITKLLLETKAPYSTEAREARVTKNYPSALRRLLKRRHAIASVAPYLVAVVGLAHEWIYENGVLCYLTGLELRILHLHRSEKFELVVDMSRFLHDVFNDSCTRHKFDLQLLYYSHDIVSCLYTSPSGQPGCTATHWLLVFNPLEGRFISVRALESISDLFVRNNHRFLYYGITADDDDDRGHEHWEIHGFDIAAEEWLNHPLHILECIGNDIGYTVCFEILDDHFYGISNQTSLTEEEIEWESRYNCFRFPLARDGFRRREDPPSHGDQLWRREHNEGPIDDRWTSLFLLRDEATGHLQAVESRREWLYGRISGRRTYYTTPIRFDPDKRSKKHHPMDNTTPRYILAKVQQSAAAKSRARNPHAVHPGDDHSVVDAVLSKCPIRAYYPSSQTSIDVVDVSTSFDPADRRFRLRGNTRRLWTPDEIAQRKCSPAAEGAQDPDGLLRRIDNLYKSEYGLLWPPEQDPSAPNAALSDLHAILNPPGHLCGGAQGSWDERSMVYSTGATAEGLKALVFISWDPSIYLAGTAPYPGDMSFGRAGDWTDGRSTAGFAPPPAAKAAGGGKGKGIDTAENYPPLQYDATSRFTPENPVVGGDAARPASWRSIEPAQYLTISRAYHFAR
ncbi:hypothetical protein N657DRAFT_575625 [Parathielavia appendiculata]|uniref:F-box domain-containing protein n=1 Tax=Parathielavia appendiculata TaxID=2587402 RepID=A0AAN6TXR5_9PEZI|nr:hypothetical protein N657DRAFT_575625 [Parathielavia appendiculata]